MSRKSSEQEKQKKIIPLCRHARSGEEKKFHAKTRRREDAKKEKAASMEIQEIARKVEDLSKAPRLAPWAPYELWGSYFQERH